MSTGAVVAPHPAKFSPQIETTIVDLLLAHTRGGPVLDPFAGVGGVHKIVDAANAAAAGTLCFWSSLGVEIEPEWAAAHPSTVCGDSTRLGEVVGSVLCPDARFDAIVTSPAYGNRMADAYNGRDGSRRVTYRLALGRTLDESNGARLQWGPEYRTLHDRVWAECSAVAAPGAVFVLNVSDHIRDGRRVPVSGWHLRTLARYGWQPIDVVPVVTRRMRGGANGAARVDAELVAVLRRD